MDWWELGLQKTAEMIFYYNPQIQPFHVLFPIPLVELGANKSLVQNTGY